MESALVYLLAAVSLFVMAFISKRRFGMLGLALASGSLLSGIWAFDGGLIASALGFPTNAFVSAIVASIIVLLPAAVLLFHGYTYKTLIGRIIGASLFMLLAMSFLIEPLGSILSPAGLGLNIYNWIIIGKNMIIGAVLIFAVVDLSLTKPADSSKKRR